MPIFHRNQVDIHYEIEGDGFPILLFAPGGMLSAASFWENAEWDPIKTLSPHFTVIAMDQRNAGDSRAPVSGRDGWHSYAEDHLALLDHLNIDQTHLLGGCIGGPYCLGVIKAHRERVASAVLQQPIGSDNNRALFYSMFDNWADAIKDEHPEAKAEDWLAFRSNMYDGEFLYNVDRDFVAACAVPMLVLMGSDPYHPETISRELADLAPNVTLIEEWKNPEKDGTVEAVISFLKAATPA